MADKLLIVESPAKAKTISRFLKDDFIITSTLGHIRDLPARSLGVNIEKNFEPYYEIVPKRKQTVSQIKQHCSKAKVIYLATDPDREGEAIAWHIVQAAKIENAKRIVFHEITKSALLNALQNPREIDLNLVDAQQARRILDRLVGYKISPYLWKKIKSGLSAGRVQSVALRLVVEREKEVESFIPVEYWNITALLSKKEDARQFEAKLIEKNKEKMKIEQGEAAQSILKELEDAEYIVSEIRTKPVKRNSPAPFITSTLQQEASKRYGLSPSKTMFLAQQLYEGVKLGEEGEVGLITYHRTDSTNISDAARESGRNYIREKFGDEYVEKTKRIFKAIRGAQEAHEAIRPTDIFLSPDKIKKYLSADLYKLYRLIYNRLVASLMTPAEYLRTEVDIIAKDYLFRVVGEVLLFSGYRKIWEEEKQKEEGEEEGENNLPPLSEEEVLQLIEIRPTQHFTSPPPRYTEATLVKVLEDKGIGRPSTYAPTVDTLKQRKYVEKKEKYLLPTQLGRVITEVLIENFPQVMDIDFTAKMEDDLDKIEEGKANWKKTLTDFYEPFSQSLLSAYQRTERIKLPDEVSDKICEKCGKQMVIKDGKYGKFIACPGYPACKNIKSLNNNATSVKCQEDGCDGNIMRRRSKKGRIFYGCSNYPNCKFTSYKLPS